MTNEQKIIKNKLGLLKLAVALAGRYTLLNRV
jgi:hypothetical protein